ncbi:hypothetical protein [Paenibacillus amylolyticus]|uniref:hypothetical protein n=1 Tax=Paenibacillus amylolyticus TaxID=1451 RepID=UPI0033943686
MLRHLSFSSHAALLSLDVLRHAYRKHPAWNDNSAKSAFLKVEGTPQSVSSNLPKPKRNWNVPGAGHGAEHGAER